MNLVSLSHMLPHTHFKKTYVVLKFGIFSLWLIFEGSCKTWLHWWWEALSHMTSWHSTFPNFCLVASAADPEKTFSDHYGFWKFSDVLVYFWFGWSQWKTPLTPAEASGLRKSLWKSQSPTSKICLQVYDSLTTPKW